MVGTIRRWADYCFRSNIKLSLPIVFLFGLVKKSYRHNKLLPIAWLDENRTNFKITLDSQKRGYSYGPGVSGGIQRVEQVRLPAVNLYYFENARISVLSSSILLDNKIIIERVEGVDVIRCDYSSGHVLIHNTQNALVQNIQITHLEQGIFLGGNGAFNYYHWMIEILPKLQYLNELDKIGYEGFPLLVSEDVDHIKSFREALNIIAKDRSVLMLNRDKTYCADRLVYINAPNNLPFNLRQNDKMRISDFLIRPSSIKNLRNQFLMSSGFPAPAKESRRIYFARHNERRNYNQEEVFSIFRQQGFQKVFMEELSLKEQISLIYNAEVLAGPTGAEWTNLIFCHEGTKCLCWMAEEFGDFSAFSNLAKIVDADLRYVTFRTAAKSVRDLNYRSYSLVTKIIMRELDKLLGATA
jgi:capsular polysaccharide biosynthesis protein